MSTLLPRTTSTTPSFTDSVGESPLDHSTPESEGSDDFMEHREITLTRAFVALVDIDDFERIAAFKWQVQLHRDGRRYATRPDYSTGSQRTLYMHREIIGARIGMHVDHRDNNGLNNRRSNIREATPSQNSANRHQLPANSSGYRGVSRHARDGNWQVSIRVNRKSIFLGLHATAEDAARAYDKAATHHFGEFARLNFPRQVQDAD